MKICVIVPCFNEEDSIIPFSSQLLKEIEIYDYRLIFIDDGSIDNTLNLLKTITSENPRISYISLSKNFGHQNALKAGYDYSNGDCCICLDADLQQPPYLIHEFIKKWREGYDIVYGIRVDEQNLPWFKRFTAAIFYKTMNMISNIDLTPGASDFRLCDKKVVLVIKNIQENNIFFRGIISWAGFKQAGITYKVDKRFAGDSKYTFRKMMSLSIVGITSFSVNPLRISSLIGCFISGLSFCYGFYALFIHLYTKETIPGWTSLIVSFLFITGLQFIMIGIIGEYLGKSFIESKKRPSYLVSENSLELEMDCNYEKENHQSRINFIGKKYNEILTR